MRTKLKTYYRITKPGIIYGNLMTTIGGFLYGAILEIQFGSLIAIVAGTGFVIASGCVFNNYLDRDIDQHMKRTKKRATVTGEISPRATLIYGSVLGVIGSLILAIFTNTLTTAIGAFGLVSYALIYTYVKKHSVHGTLVGTIPGALPPVAGYTAATNSLDMSAWIIFVILVLWQMVHFYAIAIFRRSEYKKAKVPVMSVVFGVWATKIQMLFYGVAFLIAVVALAWKSYAGLLYLAIMIPLSVWWLAVLFMGPWASESEAWARKVFFMSLLMLPAFSFALAINAWTP
jgi:protoheme IX farnesyltransferase